MEGELNFIHFMPPETRFPMLKSWYIGDGAVETTNPDEVVSDRFGSKIEYRTDDPKRELMEMVVETHLLKETGIGFDEINYHRPGSPPMMPKTFTTPEDILTGFRALAAGAAFIRYHNESGVNLLYIRIRDFGGEDMFVSVVINRWHDNVSSLFGEAKRLDASKDTMDVLSGSIGSYPNHFFVIDGKDIPDLFESLEGYDGSPDYFARIWSAGVSRGSEDFWETYDWFQSRLESDDPLRAGLYDLNRYYADAEDPAE
jgi:hypothetical protein